MSESLILETEELSGSERVENPERWKNLIVVLVLINTLLVSVVAGLQVDANIRSSQADSQSQYNAILASGEVAQSSVQGTYDLNSYAEALTEQQQALVLEYSALLREKANDQRGSQDLTIDAAASQARADQAKSLSVLLSDPRYAPSTQFSQPDTAAYMKDLYAPANSQVEIQNASADSYQRWNNKSDGYVAVLTILSVAFFLLGIAQSVSPRLRILFAGFSMGVMALASLWGITILIR